MNTILAVLFVGFIAASTAATKPDCSNVADGVQFPDLFDCSKFYICSKGELNEADCGEGLHYNPTKHYCELPSLAGCTIKATLPDCSRQIDGVTLPMVGKCAQFYICIDQVPHAAHCPNGLEYSDKHHVCVLPSISDCVRSAVHPPATNTPPVYVPTAITPPAHSNSLECAARLDGTKLPIYGECSRFLICIGQIAQIASCPSGLEYSEVHEVCVEAHMSGCIQPTLPPSTIAPPVVTSPPHVSSLDCAARLDGTTFPMHGECSRYLICIDQVSHVASCTSGLEYSAIQKTCVQSNLSGCVSAIITPPVLNPILPEDSHIIRHSNAECVDKPYGSFVAYPGDCTKYITCLHEEIVTNCPDTLHFNPVTEGCDWPENVKC